MSEVLKRRLDGARRSRDLVAERRMEQVGLTRLITAPPRRSAPSGGAFVYAGYAAAIIIDGRSAFISLFLVGLP